MKNNNAISHPSLYHRIFSVWYRHVRVYGQHIISNGFPPFLEPLIFLAGIGLGLGQYITDDIGGQTYLEFLAVGLLVTASMWTASFECTFGTFIRLEFQKTYDGMLAAPITAKNLIVGEIFWAGSKGLFFSAAVLSVMCIVSAFGKVIVPLPNALAAPVMGFVNGMMFASLGLFVTSFVKTINHFNFFMTGLISPMFFFSGVVFEINRLPENIRPIAEIVPLTHSVRLMRTICGDECSLMTAIWDGAYMILFILSVGYFAVKRLEKRLIL
jgi:lipooligosaccharide transport system permease protein